MSDGEKSYTATGRMRRASYQTVCQWVKDALSAVPPYTIISRSIKAEIVDAPLPEEQAGPLAETIDDLPLSLVSLFHSDSIFLIYFLYKCINFINITLSK